MLKPKGITLRRIRKSCVDSLFCKNRIFNMHFYNVDLYQDAYNTWIKRRGIIIPKYNRLCSIRAIIYILNITLYDNKFWALKLHIFPDSLTNS